MACCKAKEYGGWCEVISVDDLVNVDGQDYCVFHAPQNRKHCTLAEFNSRVFDRINNAINTNSLCNLSGTIFEGDISFSQYNKKNPLPAISFFKATFCGEANFRNVTFSGVVVFKEATFSGQAYFLNATFSNKANFSNAKFSDEAYFFNVFFSNEATFHNAKFSDKAGFSKAIFSNAADFSHATFSDVANFENAIFSNVAGFREATFSGQAYFLNATFSGIAIFWNATFSNAAYFSNAIFSNEADFFRATFSNEVSFSKTIFSNEAKFKYTKFSNKAYFYKAIFSNEVDFSKAIFSDDADFIDATFIGKALFSKITFPLKADFTRTHIKSDGIVRFELTTFKNEANFKELRVEGEVSFTGGENERETFSIFHKGASFENALFYNKIRFEKVNLTKTVFKHADLGKAEFVDCLWPKIDFTWPKLGLEWINPYSWLKIREKVLFEEDRLLKDARSEEYESVEILYRKLKQRAVTDHNWLDVSAWHYGEKEMKRRTPHKTKLSSKIILFLYWLSSGYAERPKRAGFWLGVLILFFSIITMFFSVPVQIAGTPEWITKLSDPSFDKYCASLLNTIKVVTFQKDMYFSPACLLADVFKHASQIVIPIQSALFVLAVRNKFRR